MEDIVDPDLEEIKKATARTLALAEDTNRMVRGMRNAARWGMFFQIVWWMLIFAASGAAYVYYLQPYVTKLVDLYNQVEVGNQQAQGLGDMLKNLTSPTSSTHH